MSLLSRSLRRSVLPLLCMLSGVCAAQQGRQFQNVPVVEATGGRVTSFITGTFQSPPSIGTDILFVNAPVGNAAASSTTVGTMLYGQGFTTLPLNQITFPNATN